MVHYHCSFLLVCALAGCDNVFFECPTAEDAPLSELGERLSQTGLYADIATGELSAGVRPYRPLYELWSDGADKRRWIFLPPNSAIDSSDMDSWSFPVGTKLWKEFSRDGQRLETRLLVRTGAEPLGWQSVAYVWLPNGSDAVVAPLGFIDVAGTNHDVPAAGECIGCHGGRESYVLGFSAIQLSGPTSSESISLEDLVDDALLSDQPSAAPRVPGNETERAALGYLHVNCGHCHNQRRPHDAPCFDPQRSLDLWLTVNSLATPEDTPTYRTTVGTFIKPGKASDSLLLDRVSTRTFIFRMPPLGTEEVDLEGVGILREWGLNL